MKVDIVVNIDRSKERKIGDLNVHLNNKLLYGELYYHIIQMCKIKDQIKISANVFNEPFAKIIIDEMRYLGFEKVNTQKTKIKGKEKDFVTSVFTIKKIPSLKAIREDIDAGELD